MDAINEPSPLGAELSRWLSALGAGIRAAAAAAAPGDPAAPLAEEILESVERWLAGTPVAEAPIQETPIAASPAPSAPGWYALLDQASAQQELPELNWGAMSFVDGWEPFHLALLGLAPDRAARLAQEAAALAVAHGAALDSTTVEAIPGEEYRMLVPGLGGAMTIAGLRTALDAPLPADFAALSATGDLLAAIRTAAAVAILASRAGDLRLPNPDPSKNQLPRIAGPAALTFRKSLADAARRAAEATTPRERWLGWVKLDEAIHAAVVLPLPHPQSWWALTSHRLRQALSRAADEARRALGRIDLQVLRGEYRMIRKQSDDRTDVRTTSFGHPGQVAVCLRVYTAIGDERFPGRVIYRP